MDWKEKTIISSDGKYQGTATGHTERCRLEGCRGERVRVEWKDGTITKPCSLGLYFVMENVFKIYHV